MVILNPEFFLRTDVSEETKNTTLRILYILQQQAIRILGRGMLIDAIDLIVALFGPKFILTEVMTKLMVRQTQ